ncbi:hypothetical protein TNCV_2636241 [Trichonephila clavipes]|nr:hypothetical protein TNCV_2636241 [Trichonephila clavipes]
MESSSNKPSWQDISAYSPTTKQLLGPSGILLHLRNGVLYRKFESEDGKTFGWQLVLSSISYPRGTQRIAWQPNREVISAS